MPLTVKSPSRWNWRTLLPWYIGVLPVLCGVAVASWQAERDLEQASRGTAVHVVAQVERILDNTSGAAHALMPLAGRPCPEVTLALREQVTRNAFVRSTALFDKDRLYCSSLFGDYDEAVKAGDYTNGQLWLMPGNAVTPDHPLLVYRVSQGGRGALATVDGDHLTGALRQVGAHNELRLWVGSHWMGQDGQVREGVPPSSAAAPTALSSTRYPFTVIAGFSAGRPLEQIRSQYLPVLGLLLVLGVLAGLACRWQLRRARSPRAELQRALEAGEFLAYYQPVVRKGDYRWAGVEVLMRWQHPREGLVRPDLFIPYAEHSGQIVAMTQALMRQTAQDLAPFAALLDDGFHVGINITADHCRSLDLLEDCRHFMGSFPPGRVALTLELTERKLIEATPITLELFEKLHAMGVMIALDDFGTGHSSLSYLRQFKVDYLKIDQSFVAMIGGEALSQHILDSIIELSAKLGLGIVAEGVETAQQRDYLAGHGVDFQQGYLFARPMTLEALLHALAGQQASPRLPKVAPPEIMRGDSLRPPL